MGGRWTLESLDCRLRREQEPAATLGLGWDGPSHLRERPETLPGTGKGQPGFLLSVSLMPTVVRGSSNP